MLIGTKYEPLIKGKGFCPNPVQKYGIPDFADSAINPDVLGTVAHEDYFNEQIDRCLNGYTTGGIYIPGRYYYYLNFCQISTPKRGEHYPEYVDLDLEFFNLVNFVKKEGQYKNDPTAGGKGIISLKRRRAGVSFKFAHGVFGYGLRFNPSAYRGGVVAGLSDYSDDFYKKFKECNSRIVPEFRLNPLLDNQEEWVAGYEYKTAVGWLKDGSFNTISVKTAQANENVFKGAALDDCGFEEGGEFKNLTKCYGSTKACFTASRGRMVGTPYIWGTGGNIKSSSKGFKSMLADAEKNHLIPFEIFGPRIQVGFFVGSINELNEPDEHVPNLLKNYPNHSREQLLGCEDTVAATDFILARRKELAGAIDKQPYYDWFQDNPLDRKEAFLNFSGNPYNPEKLRNQLAIIETLVQPRYKKVHLEWKKDKDGARLMPLQVEVREAKEEEEEKDCVLMLEEPIPHYKDLDIAGCDSYDLDQSSTSKSLGSFAIMRRRDMETGRVTKRPVLLIRMRPKRKEIFYDNCLKAAVLYNLRGNVLIDIANGLIFDYFKNNSGEKYLAVRPKAFESKDSKQEHKWGVKITKENKPDMIALTQTWVEDYSDECWFPHILSEISDYDVKADDSDWDCADAWGIALMRDVDMRKVPQDLREDNEKDTDLPLWYERGDGMMVDSTRDPENDWFANHSGGLPLGDL